MKKTLVSFFCSLVLFVSISSCSSSFKEIDSEVGRRATIEEANNFLTHGQCKDAIDTLTPLYQSIHVDNEVRVVLASAYACAGGLQLLNFIDALSSIDGDDIWSPMVKANHSATNDDQKINNLKRAAEILRETSSIEGGLQAEFRPNDANLFMVFVQASLIGTTISPTNMGNADSTTGKKTANITGLGSGNDQCTILVAMATINDCLDFVDAGSTLGTVNDKLDDACGGTCPTHKDPDVCDTAETAAGAALITGIDGQWAS